MRNGLRTAWILGAAALAVSPFLYQFIIPKPLTAPSLLTLLDHARTEHSGAIFERFTKQKQNGYFNQHQPDKPPLKIGDQIIYQGLVNYKPRGNAEQLKVLQSGQNTLSFIKPSALENCPQLKYYGHLGQFEKELSFFRDASPTMDAVEAIRQSKRDMESWAAYYLGEDIDFADLENIADVEIEKISAAYAALKVKHDISNLDEYAGEPEFIEHSAKSYKERYAIEMTRARNITSHHFYDYDLRRARALVVGKCHAYKAYASYHTPNRIQIYECDDQPFDSKRTMFLAAHEYFPGHHLHFDVYKKLSQCSISPRPFVGFSEGLATYGEYLSADELYAEPDQELGWLDYRLIRAMRIKIDVARFRDQKEPEALKIIWNAHMPERLKDNFSEELHRLRNSREFQHLKYMLGHMAISRVRGQIETDMGDAFEERRFHHALLTTPLTHGPYLYEQVKTAMSLDISNQLSPELMGATN